MCAIIQPGDGMYNQEIKKRYLEFLRDQSSDKTAAAVFAAAAETEERVKKDIAQFSKEDTDLFVSTLEIEELSKVYLIRSAIKKYLDWCRENEVFDGIQTAILDGFTTNIDISGRIAKIAFRDENDLVFAMRKTREFDDGYAAPVVFALAWIGLLRPEIYELKDDEVDLPTMTVRGFIIPEKIGMVLSEFRNTREGLRENNITTFKVYKDFTSVKFIKPFRAGNSTRKGDEYSARRMETMMAEFNSRYVSLGYPPRFTFDNVWKSGRCHALWEMESDGFDINAKENEQEILDLFRGKKNIAGILWYYKQYKKAFNL